jgi:hypothetical protein
MVWVSSFEGYAVDAVLTFLVDVVFFGIGKALWGFLRKTGIGLPELGHWGFVVCGLLVVVILLFDAFLTWGL